MDDTYREDLHNMGEDGLTDDDSLEDEEDLDEEGEFDDGEEGETF